MGKITPSSKKLPADPMSFGVSELLIAWGPLKGHSMVKEEENEIKSLSVQF